MSAAKPDTKKEVEGEAGSEPNPFLGQGNSLWMLCPNGGDAILLAASIDGSTEMPGGDVSIGEKGVLPTSKLSMHVFDPIVVANDWSPWFHYITTAIKQALATDLKTLTRRLRNHLGLPVESDTLEIVLKQMTAAKILRSTQFPLVLC